MLSPGRQNGDRHCRMRRLWGKAAEWAAAALILSLGCSSRSSSTGADVGGGADAPTALDGTPSDGTAESRDMGMAGVDTGSDLFPGGSDAGSDMTVTCTGGRLGAACGGAGE